MLGSGRPAARSRASDGGTSVAEGPWPREGDRQWFATSDSVAGQETREGRPFRSGANNLSFLETPEHAAPIHNQILAAV